MIPSSLWAVSSPASSPDRSRRDRGRLHCFRGDPLLNRGHIRHLPRDMALTGLLYSIPMVTIGAASVFGWMLAYLRGPAVVSG